MRNNTIRNVVATGIGAALFVVIGMINIPTPVPNTSSNTLCKLVLASSLDQLSVS